MRNKPMIMSRPRNQRHLQRGAMAVAIVTLAASLPLASSAVADEPFQVVTASGQLVCSDFSQPAVFGSEVKVSGPGDYFVNVGPGLGSQVTITLFTDTTLGFELTSGSDAVDVVVVKGSADAQSYTYADAAFGGFPPEDSLTTANVQKIQRVTVCSDGESTEFANVPLPSCNVLDNRDDLDDNDCTAEDDAIDAIIFKYATQSAGGVERGDSFFCQCGDADVQTVAGTLDISNNTELDEVEAISIISINPTCFAWSTVGGKKECVIP